MRKNHIPVESSPSDCFCAAKNRDRRPDGGITGHVQPRTMTTDSRPDSLAARVLVRGVHLDLTPALQQVALHKAEHLLRHADRIVRIRLDLELDRTRGAQDVFIAKGRIEIRGPDLIAQVHSEDAYKSLDLLVDKLDELLRRRHQKRINTRNDKRRLAPTGRAGEE